MVCDLQCWVPFSRTPYGPPGCIIWWFCDMATPSEVHQQLFCPHDGLPVWRTDLRTGLRLLDIYEGQDRAQFATRTSRFKVDRLRLLLSSGRLKSATRIRFKPLTHRDCDICKTRSISWLLIPWLLALPGHQHRWHWLCRIGTFLSYLRKDFNHLCHVNGEEWQDLYIYVFVPYEKFST